jgi:t-SNARE complex subunit (syntaxin)
MHFQRNPQNKKIDFFVIIIIIIIIIIGHIMM